ncbi:hypothetical protein C8R45DRAFT_988932 [Mycena sanguinolenta]|nr:hypothetical protein C8R45DRAFT_988932 [Mycena sanguinolenta]
MREIGCCAFVLKLLKNKNPKIFNCSIECVMVGYSPTSTGTYHCYDRKTGRIHVTWNVEFIESQDEVPRPLTAAQTSKRGEETAEQDTDESEAPRKVVDPAIHDVEEEFGEVNDDPSVLAIVEAVPPGRPARTRTARGEDGAFPDMRKEAAVAEARAAEARAQERRAEAKTRRATVEEVHDEDDMHDEELAAMADDNQYEYWALSVSFSEEWREAYEAELNSIKLHGVYELVPRESVPKGRKIIRSRPIFKIKRGSDGEIPHPVLNPFEWSCMLALPSITRSTTLM